MFNITHPDTPSTSPTLKKSFKKIVLIFSIVVLGVLGTTVGVVTAAQGKLPFLNKSESQVSKTQLEKLIAEVGKMVELPTGEEPTLATVTDKSKLTDQAFFAKAENGDQVLLYVQAKKAYLYRPSTKKMIDVTVLSLVDSEKTAMSSNKPIASIAPSQTSLENPTDTVVTKRISLSIYNGTSVEGATLTIADKLKNAPVKASVLVRTKAVKSDYLKTIIVDPSGIHGAEAKQLATFLNGEVSTLPAGETAPTTDIGIIVGQSSLQ